MSFIETPRFPDGIALNAKRIRRSGVHIIELASGFEEFYIPWSQKRREYDIGIAIKKAADYDEVNQWIEALDGPADAFRFKDWGDYTATYTTGLLYPLVGGVEVGNPGFGYGVPTYQLIKKYSRGSKVKYRNIRKPIASGFQVQANGANVASSLNTTTGVVTMSASQSKSISSHTVGATHVINLSSAFSPNVTVGQRVYLSGVTGTAATLLNNASFAVASVNAAQIVLSVNTTGLTASGGTAALYYQDTDALTWQGQFDVPVRFRDADVEDTLVMGLTSGTLQESNSIVLIEIRI